VLGPLYGAVVLALAEWQAIFALNLAVGLVLAAALRALGTEEPRRRPDWWGLALLVLTLVAVVLAMVQPTPLARDVTLGLGFVPVTVTSRWLTPVGLAAVALGAEPPDVLDVRLDIAVGVDVDDVPHVPAEGAAEQVDRRVGGHRQDGPLGHRALEDVDIVDVPVTVVRVGRKVAAHVGEAAERRGVEVIRTRHQERSATERQRQRGRRDQRAISK